MRLRRIVALALFGALVVAATLATERLLRRGRDGPFADYARLRRHTVNAHLAQADAPFVFLVGDSHAERISPAATLCGLPIVNGGVGGARASDVLRLVRQFAFPRPPATIVLTVGSNDLARKLDPTAPASRGRFESEARDLIAELKKRSTDLVVAALPPFAPELGRDFDLDGVRAYSDILATLCRGGACRFADPAGPLREGSSGAARPTALSDGVHIADNRAWLNRLAAEICPR